MAALFATWPALGSEAMLIGRRQLKRLHRDYMENLKKVSTAKEELHKTKETVTALEDKQSSPQTELD